MRDLVPFVEFKNVKNTHGGVLLLVKLQAKIVPNRITYLHFPHTTSMFDTFLCKERFIKCLHVWLYANNALHMWLCLLSWENHNLLAIHFQ